MKRIYLLASVAVATCALTAPALSADYTPAMPVFSWSGVYGGADIGYGWGEQSLNTKDIVYDRDLDPATVNDIYTFSGFNDKFSPSGVLGGIYGGANYQFGGVVLGFDADYTWAGMSGDNVKLGFSDSSTTPPTTGKYATANVDVNWLAHVRGRLGYGFDRFMIYAAGGLAIAGYDASFDGNLPTNFIGNFGNAGDSITGWTVGGGIDWALTDNIIVRAEYLYDQFDNADFGSYRITDTASTPPNAFVGGASASGDFSVNIFRVGVSYKFGGMF
ncbi:MAG: outer membrane beta-barrel protein [Hyphomicrobiales bacterium]